MTVEVSMQVMTALTLWQPWATLVALGEKKFETRSWTTGFRGPLAIHAAKTIDHLEIATYGLFHKVLVNQGVIPKDISEDNGIPHIYPKTLNKPLKPYFPLGAVIAIVDKIEARLMTLEFLREIEDELSRRQWGKEQAFGNWTHGRFAIRLTGVRRLREPILAAGSQGLWKWKHNHELEFVD